MFKVVGVQKCSGEYNGRPWSHTKLYVLSEDKKVTGFKAEYFKVPDDVQLPQFPEFPKKPCTVSLNFDRYGNVAQVDLVSDSD